jgi:hypothetical protein
MACGLFPSQANKYARDLVIPGPPQLRGVGIVWPFAPTHLREALAAGGSTVSDTMHIMLASVTVDRRVGADQRRRVPALGRHARNPPARPRTRCWRGSVGGVTAPETIGRGAG